MTKTLIAIFFLLIGVSLFMWVAGFWLAAIALVALTVKLVLS